jgi:hypothetical protein
MFLRIREEIVFIQSLKMSKILFRLIFPMNAAHVDSTYLPISTTITILQH